MKKAPMHPREKERQKILEEKNILDSESDPRFDDLTKEATKRLSVPISTVTLIDKDREWFKACDGLIQKEGPRDISFCGHALLDMDVFICPDTLKDDRFKDNPYVNGDPHIRFYAGMRLLDKKTGLPMGVFCVKDTKPRNFSTEELSTFLQLAGKAEAYLQ